MASSEKVKRFSMRQMVDKAEKKKSNVVPAYKFSKNKTKYQTDLVNRK